MSQKNETTILVFSLVVTLALLMAGWGFFKNNIGKQSEIRSQKSATLTFLISAGEKVLIASDATPDKQAGVKAIAIRPCS